jgi:hypothetical protein
MSENTSRFANLPAALRDVRGWVVWKRGEKGDKGKFDKVPYYTNGRRRHGTQGSDADREKLATFDEAVKAYSRGGYAGIGLAMLPDWNLVGIDLDGCISDGDDISAEAEALLNAAETYTEVSPSGTGLRMFTRGSFPDRKNNAAGIEVFHAKGFLTVTGEALNGAEVATLGEPLRERITAWLKGGDTPAAKDEDKPPLDPARILEGVPEGERDEALFKYACSCRARGLPKEEGEVLVLQAARNCKPPFPDDKARKKVESAYSEKYAAGKDKVARPMAETLIEIGRRSTLFHSERKDSFAAVRGDDNIRRILPLRGRTFRRWLAKCLWEEKQQAANSESLTAALNVLDAKAQYDGERFELFNRFAPYGDAIYVDLGDDQWRAVKITAAGWEVVEEPPILFRRFAHQAALPVPERGGSLDVLGKFFNLRNEETDLHLVKAWLVAAIFPEMPRPILMLHGAQGSAKTTTAKVGKRLVDPSATETVDLGREPAQLAQVFDHNAVPLFDNLSKLPGWAPDLLCRAATGGGWSKRELYTDAEDVIFVFKRAFIMTGVNIPTNAPDLLDRMLLIELARIAPNKRKAERGFFESFEREHPKLFGALLDAVVGTLQALPDVSLPRLPRMADFARIACAYAVHSGVGANKMLDLIFENAGQQVQAVIDSDSFASALCKFMGEVVEREHKETGGLEADNERRENNKEPKVEKNEWAGTATELLRRLDLFMEFKDDRKRMPDDWPRSPESAGKRLRVLEATLAEVGIVVSHTASSTGAQRLIKLCKEPQEPQEPQEAAGRSGGSYSSYSFSPTKRAAVGLVRPKPASGSAR